jgi:hypothetical protein
MRLVLALAVSILPACGAPALRVVQASTPASDGSVWYAVTEERAGGVVVVFRCSAGAYTTGGTCERIELQR